MNAKVIYTMLHHYRKLWLCSQRKANFSLPQEFNAPKCFITVTKASVFEPSANLSEPWKGRHLLVYFTAFRHKLSS